MVGELMSNKILISAMKNEAPFIIEWVAYHRLIGFDRIIIFSNASDDGTQELLSSLAAESLIEHYPHIVPKNTSPQANTARLVTEMDLLNDGDWIIWLDADEFLNIHVGNKTVDSLVSALDDKDGILINWRVFGDSGNPRFTGRHISNDYTRCARPFHPMNIEVKAFYKKSKQVTGLAQTGIHRPRINLINDEKPVEFICGKTNPIDMSFKIHSDWMAGKDDGINCKGAQHERGWAYAQINHYILRSPEYFCLKKHRGRGWAANQAGQQNRRHTQRFYRLMNKNGHVEKSILFWEGRVTTEAKRIRSLEKVKQAESEAQTKTNILLESLSGEISKLDEILAPDFQITLPNAEREYLTSVYEKSTVILEYGSGGSTLLAAEMGKTVFSVESDERWAKLLDERIKQKAPMNENVHIVHSDIGKTTEWGYPVDGSAWQKYHNYPLGVWAKKDFIQPDVVLIDGRFRTACFAAVLLNTRKKVTVLFDDYLDRPKYHTVERFFKPTKFIGRMAVFSISPKALSREKVIILIQMFGQVQ